MEKIRKISIVVAGLLIVTIFIVIGIKLINSLSNENLVDALAEYSDKHSQDENVEMGAYSDKKRTILDFYGQYYMVYTYTDDKVDSFSYYYDMEKEGISEEQFEILKAGYMKQEVIKDVRIEGNYMVVEYKDSQFFGMTKQDIESAYSYLKQVDFNL